MERQSSSKLWQAFRRRAQAITPLITLIVLIIIFTVFSDEHRFATWGNIQNVAQQAASLAILGTAMTFVLLIAEIDLSVGGVATAAGVFAAWLFVEQGMSGEVAALAGIFLGLVCGLVNGFVTAYIGVPSFMTTLAMETITLGIALWLTRGRPIFDVPEIGTMLGSGLTIILVAVVVIAIGWFILKYTRFGRYVYMTGSNREAAELSGVNTKLVTIAVLTLAGALAGFAGVVNTGRLGSANPEIFQGLTLDTIAAVVLGGTSLFGGIGSVFYTVIGLLVFAILKNGLNLVNIDIYLKGLITGIILLLALILNVYALKLGQVKEEAVVRDVGNNGSGAPPEGGG